MLASSESSPSRETGSVRPGEAFSLGSNALRHARKAEVLTPHERRILELLAQGNHIKEIAALFDIAYPTAMLHRDNILRKLHLHRSAHLILYAVQHGIIELPLLTGRSTPHEAGESTEAKACM